MTKRFYKQATAISIENQFQIHLDDKALRSPKGSYFFVQNKQLANYIADEWNAVADIIQPQNMPLTQICMTTIDFYDEKKSDWTRDILAYLDSDALCFWAGEIEPIYNRQERLMKPVLNSLENKFSLPIKITDKLEIIAQDQRWNNHFLSFLNSLSPIQFTNFYLTTIECGSIFLATALYHNLTTPDDVFDIIFLEDQYKSEIYKENIHGTAPDFERKQKTTKKFLNAAQIIFQSP
jgi:chaperone required for assembly of F1-ATPase